MPDNGGILKELIVQALLDKAADSSGEIERELRQVAAYVASPRLCARCDHGQEPQIDGALLESLAHRCANCGSLNLS